MKDYDKHKANKFPKAFRAFQKKNGKVANILLEGIDNKEDNSYDCIFQDFWNEYVIKLYGIENDLRKQMSLAEEFLFTTEPDIVSKCFGMPFDSDIMQLETKDDLRRFNKIFNTNLVEDYSIEKFEQEIKKLAKRYIFTLKKSINTVEQSPDKKFDMDFYADKFMDIYKRVDMLRDCNHAVEYNFRKVFCDALMEYLKNEPNEKMKTRITEILKFKFPLSFPETMNEMSPFSNR